MTRALRQIAFGAACIAVVIAGGLLIRDVAGDRPVGLDAAWQALMSTHRTPLGVEIAQAMAWIGQSPGVWIVTLAIAPVAVLLRRWRTAIAVLLAAELGATCSTAIKVLAARPRPGGAVDLLSSFAYPSGHTTWAAAVAVSLALAVPRVWTWVSAGAWISFMAWSRTYLGVHWLSDVAAGALLGIGVALVSLGVVELVAPDGRRSLVPPPPPEAVEE